MKIRLGLSGFFFFLVASALTYLGCFVPPIPPNGEEEAFPPSFEMVKINSSLDLHVSLPAAQSEPDQDTEIELFVLDTDSNEASIRIFVDAEYGKPLSVDPAKVYTNTRQKISVRNLCTGDSQDPHILEIYVTDTNFVADGEHQRNVESLGRREHVVRIFSCN